ncbi:septum site-determining protein MinC [Methyloversatilis sp. XJ19-49]|uniref:septum site-determining protein MinC n=1 Tax=Methyloversatilis sp. XJ19-49 TaxID=2963429 RepID=UPI00211C4900|nr:septum site-determining protein MinC [Methyloversatilis sp. XJ19-49]MCQ9376574.1 septum site-determining protein MinC [Methyloversatilis sp. XJ19-49]
MARKPAPPAVELKSATLEAMRALLHAADASSVAAALDARLGATPGFFSGEPVVIDASALPPDAAPDWAGIRNALARHALTAVAVQGADDAAAEAARALGFAVVAGDAQPDRAPVSEPVVEPVLEVETVIAEAPEPVVAPPAAARRAEIIDKPLRSGQRVYARGCDLIVLAMVSAGAEVIADGNIHIYAPLRGRALAGASGDVQARIFTTCFEAELVSIAGVYRTFEHTAHSELLRKPAHVRLQEHEDKQVLDVAALATT